MRIKKIKFENFRNFPFLELEFSSGINVIYGENGQGKTNIIEGIYMCSTGRSQRHSKENEQILFNKEEAHIKGEFFENTSSFRIDIHIKKNFRKGIALNRVPIKKVSDLLGKIGMVIFSPEDLNIVKGSPSIRRNFINTELCQLDSIYVRNLINYTRLIKSRHELFRQLEEEKITDSDFWGTLDIIDLQLAEFGKQIIDRRTAFIEEINRDFYNIHYEISRKKEKVKLVYEPSVHSENFYEELLRYREKDKIYKSTSVGPQRDDFSFYEGNKNLKTYGSQGQQRTCVLSLKLAEFNMLKGKKKVSPILLLDDVLSELDRNRQNQLLKRIEGIQTIITGTGIDEFIEEKISGAKKFKVYDASVYEWY